MIYVSAPPGSKVVVSFPSGYDIEQSDGCKYDWLVFQDGPFFFSPVIERLCGTKASDVPSINSTGRYMRMWFRTDDFIQHTGFALRRKHVEIDGEVSLI